MSPKLYFMKCSERNISQCILALTCVNYKLLIFQQVDVYLNETIKIDKQIKLANQLIQSRTRDRNGKDDKNSYF